jgi:tetratricopeptide (TPR) repeat protein
MTTPSETLSFAFQYILEADGNIEEAAESQFSAASRHNAVSFLNRRTERRQLVKERLDAARELLTLLEEECPDATAAAVLETGEEVMLTVPLVSMVCYRTEANVMFRCYDDRTAARTLIEHAIAIDPSDSLNHALHGSFCADLNEFPAAIASMERAILLDPTDMNYKLALNDIRRGQERFTAEQAAKPQRSKWNPKSWLT